jgi:hypothetical protein
MHLAVGCIALLVYNEILHSVSHIFCLFVCLLTLIISILLLQPQRGLYGVHFYMKLLLHSAITTQRDSRVTHE